MRSFSGFPLLISRIAPIASAGRIQTLEKTLAPVVMEANRLDQVGVAESANHGVIPRERLKNGPLSRPAEILKVITVIIAAQHSDNGKASQYDIRGLHSGHGTEPRTLLAGSVIHP